MEPGRWATSAGLNLDSISEAIPMTDSWSIRVCIMGTGPVGGSLACRLASAGVGVALIDMAVRTERTKHKPFFGTLDDN